MRDFEQYLADNPDFVRQAITKVKIVNVNDATVELLAAQRKEDLLDSLHKIFLPETEDVFGQVLVAIAEGRTSFQSETALRTLKGDRVTALFTITFPPEADALGCVLVSIMDVTERNQHAGGVAPGAGGARARQPRDDARGADGFDCARSQSAARSHSHQRRGVPAWLGRGASRAGRGAQRRRKHDQGRHAREQSGISGFAHSPGRPSRRGRRWTSTSVIDDVIRLVQREALDQFISLRLEFAIRGAPVLARSGPVAAGDHQPGDERDGGHGVRPRPSP